MTAIQYVVTIILSLQLFSLYQALPVSQVLPVSQAFQPVGWPKNPESFLPGCYILGPKTTEKMKR